MRVILTKDHNSSKFFAALPETNSSQYNHPMKRFLPLIVLLVVSVFVFACALGVVYVLSVDANTAEEKIQSLLTLGVPSGIALIVLMWFGAGMDFVLSRLKNRSTRLGVSLLTYILVPLVLCVGLPALIGMGIYTAFNAPQGWKQFPASPEPAVEIVSANGTSLVIRTESDAQVYCVIGCADWQPVAEVDPLFINNGTETSTPPSFDPPEGAVEVVGIASTNMGVEERTYFALVDDGSVWYLQHNNNQYEAGFASGLFLTMAIIPAIFGLIVIYVGAGISALARRLAG